LVGTIGASTFAAPHKAPKIVKDNYKYNEPVSQESVAPNNVQENLDTIVDRKIDRLENYHPPITRASHITQGLIPKQYGAENITIDTPTVWTGTFYITKPVIIKYPGSLTIKNSMVIFNLTTTTMGIYAQNGTSLIIENSILTKYEGSLNYTIVTETNTSVTIKYTEIKYCGGISVGALETANKSANLTIEYSTYEKYVDSIFINNTFFTIANCEFTNAEATAAIYIASNATGEVKNSLFHELTHAIICVGVVNITRNIFENFTAPETIGETVPIYMAGSGNIENNIFRYIKAEGDGSTAYPIYAFFAGEVNIRYNQFINVSATGYEENPTVSCPIYLLDTQVTAIVANNTFENITGDYLVAGVTIENYYSSPVPIVVANNTFVEVSGDGIDINFSGLVVLDNNFINNTNYYGAGICSYASSNLVMINNKFINADIQLWFGYLNHLISTNNTVNKKTVYYIYNDSALATIPTDAGEILIANCTGTISDLTLNVDFMEILHEDTVITFQNVTFNNTKISILEATVMMDNCNIFVKGEGADFVMAMFLLFATFQTNAVNITLNATDEAFVIGIYVYLSFAYLNNTRYMVYAYGESFYLVYYPRGGTLFIDYSLVDVKAYDASYLYIFYARNYKAMYPAVVLINNTHMILESYGDSYIPAMLHTREPPCQYYIANTVFDVIGYVGVGFNVLEGSEISINTSTLNGFSTAVFIDASEAYLEDNVFVNNTVSLHIGFANTTYPVTVKNSGFTSREINIELASSANVTIEDNILYETTVMGVMMTECENITMKNNQFIGSGLLIKGSEKEHFTTHTITGNTVNGAPLYYGVGVTGTISGTYGEIIIADSDGATIDGISISGTDVGVELAFCDNIGISNMAFDSVRYTFYVYESNNIEISDVTAATCGEVIHAESAGISITNMYITTASVGASILSTTLTMLDSTIEHSGFGIQAHNSTVTLKGTTIVENSYGVQVMAGSTLDIDGCNISGNVFYAVSSESSTLTIKDTYIANNMGEGVKAAESQVVILGSRITRNDGYGVYADGSTLTVNNTVITENYYGLYLTKSTFNIYYGHISLNDYYGIYAEENTTGYIYFTNITVNGMHGIYNVDPDDYIYAFYCWWGSEYGPEISETADDVDPEEVYGNVVVSNFMEYPILMTTPTITLVTTGTETQYTAETIISTVAYVSPILLIGMSVAVAAVGFIIIFIVARKLTSKAAE